MTPDEARDLLDGTTPGPWGVEYDHDWAIGISAPEGIVFGPYYDQEEMEQWETGSDADLRLAAAAPVLAALAAGMREEWSRQARITGDPEWHPIRWCRSREEAERTYWTRSLPSGATVEYRVVPRYILEPETTE